MSWRALAVAGHEGDEPTARAALADPDPVARELALGALRRMDALTDEDLTSAAADPDRTVRRRVATMIADRPGVSLQPLLADTESTVVEAAAWAAGEQQPLLPAPDDAVCKNSDAAHSEILRRRSFPVEVRGNSN